MRPHSLALFEIINVETRHVRYVFADVVEFTENRTLEAQVETIAALNSAFREAIGNLETIFLPTGDGICAAILEANVAADIHLNTALRVLEYFHTWSANAAPNRSAQLRVAINESVDAVVTDVNGHRNLAGVGINSAQRLMTLADGNQIIAGRTSYETLHIRDQYLETFRMIKAEVKHDLIVTAYQFIGLKSPHLNIDTPLVVQRTELIEIEMSEEMMKPGGYSTVGMVHAINDATERWTDEMNVLLHQLKQRCNDEQRAALMLAHSAWEKFHRAEQKFIGVLRKTTQGTMYRVIMAGLGKSLVRGRAKALRGYLEEWNPGSNSDETIV